MSVSEDRRPARIAVGARLGVALVPSNSAYPDLKAGLLATFESLVAFLGDRSSEAGQRVVSDLSAVDQMLTDLHGGDDEPFDTPEAWAFQTLQRATEGAGLRERHVSSTSDPVDSLWRQLRYDYEAMAPNRRRASRLVSVVEEAEDLTEGRGPVSASALELLLADVGALVDSVSEQLQKGYDTLL